MTEKIEVQGEMVWPNPDYHPQPVPEGFNPAWVGESSYPSKLVKANPAWLIACELGKIPGISRNAFVSGVRSFDDGRVMADVLIKGEWARYVCTADEIEARKGGQRVDAALEVMA